MEDATNMVWIAIFVVGIGLAWAVQTGCYAIAKALNGLAIESEKNKEIVAKQLDRIGTKLDNLWGPIMGISNAQHGVMEQDD